jgi:hypothetical protein
MRHGALMRSMPIIGQRSAARRAKGGSVCRNPYDLSAVQGADQNPGIKASFRCGRMQTKDVLRHPAEPSGFFSLIRKESPSVLD